jgi:hypothetical protein
MHESIFEKRKRSKGIMGINNSHVYVKYQELLERSLYQHMAASIVVVMAVILKIRKKISQRKIVGSCHQYLMM